MNEMLAWLIEKALILFLLVCLYLYFCSVQKQKEIDNQMVSFPKGLLKSSKFMPINMLIMLLSALFIPWPRRQIKIDRLQNPDQYRLYRFGMSALQVPIVTISLALVFFLFNGLPC